MQLFSRVTQESGTSLNENAFCIKVAAKNYYWTYEKYTLIIYYKLIIFRISYFKIPSNSC